MTDAQNPRRRLISTVMVVLLVAMAVHFFRSPGDLEQFQRLSLPIVALTLGFQFLSLLAFNEAMRLPLRPHAKTLGFWEFYMVRTGGGFVGSLVPVAGNIAVRLAYLRRRGVTYLEFTWATVLSNVHALAAAAALAVAAAATLRAVAGPLPPVVAWLSAGVLGLGGAAVAALHYLPRLAASPAFVRWPSLKEIGRFHASPGTTAALFGLSLLRHVFNFATFGVLYAALTGHRGDLLTGGLVYALTAPVRMVNLTPANVGVNEWLVAFAGKALAFDVATGLVVALLFRAVALIAQGLGLVIGWGWLARRADRPPA